MRILLATAAPDEAFTPYGPPLGLCYLSAFLKAQGHGEIFGLDLNVSSERDFSDLCKEADVLGVYCSTKTSRKSVDLASAAKRINPYILTVVGGPHATLRPYDLIPDPSVDFVVLGEGEKTFFELVRTLKAGSREFSHLPGLVWKKGETIVVNEQSEFLRNLDEMPFPDRDIFDLDKYPSGSVTVTASRGCPYNCANCQPALNRICGPFRFRSVRNVTEEIIDIERRYGKKYLHFVDNDLTVNKRWIVEFCHVLLENGIRINWGCQGRLNTLDPELMELMKSAGCTTIGLGLETGSQPVLDRILRKGIRLERVPQVVECAKRIGLGLHLWFMIGIPGETLSDMERTVRLATSLDVASIGFSVATPWPGTDFYYTCIEKGWLLTSDWGEFNEKRYCRIRTDKFGPHDVKKCRLRILKLFARKLWTVNEPDFIVYNSFYNLRLGEIAKFRLVFDKRRRRDMAKVVRSVTKVVARTVHQYLSLQNSR